MYNISLEDKILMAFEFIGRGLVIPKELRLELGDEIVRQITEATGKTYEPEGGGSTKESSETSES